MLIDESPDPAVLEQRLRRRVGGEPLELIVGWAEFCGLRIVVEPGVFVPRRRTEFVVDLAARLAPRVVVDLCCGTGAIGAALVHRLAGVEVHAADLDPAAVACASRNLAASCVYEGDLFDALPPSLAGRVDAIVVNAPYVPTGEVGLMPREARLYEAPLALDGGTDGVDVHRRVIAGARHWLAPRGALLIETSTGQARLGVAACVEYGLCASVERSDEFDATVLVARVAAQPKRPCT